MPHQSRREGFAGVKQAQGVTNLQKYQDETRSRRDLKVKKREFDVDNLVLLWSPRTESSGKL
jgi:hypothetical protein